ncbi:MAG TPA: MBL fold metallo-hydrolase [Verrucomicrobiae bacterium]|nr:MBL fold metallo-hydrolase [Verrucomicrobiae bacterium]
MRGSVPSPGADTARYGGNTACVEVRNDGEIIVLDAGTGLRALGCRLLAEFKNRPLNLTLLVTHTHWDHIQGLPFFAPVFNPRCRIRILGGRGLRKALFDAFDNPYFPVSLKTLSGHVQIEELKKADFRIGKVRVSAQLANHPGVCLGYRLFLADGSLAYFPDNESVACGNDRRLIEFVRGVDALLLDSQYNSAEYERHAGWGHGSVDDSVALAVKASVKKLFLFHHDPARSDRQVDALLQHARKLAAKQKSKLKVEAAREGMTIQLGGN